MRSDLPLSVRDETGTLALVVGPSGAGKDSLINAARAAFADDPRLVFARRTVTRPSSRWEDHDSLDEAGFVVAAAAGRFALTWQAHGLHYGLGREIETALAAGYTVVCNVSRTIVAEARARFPRVHVFLITVDPAILAERLRARGREPEADSRTGAGRPELRRADCETVIDNSGALDRAVAVFVSSLGNLAAD